METGLLNSSPAVSAVCNWDNLKGSKILAAVLRVVFVRSLGRVLWECR